MSFENLHLHNSYSWFEINQVIQESNEANCNTYILLSYKVLFIDVIKTSMKWYQIGQIVLSYPFTLWTGMGILTWFLVGRKYHTYVHDFCIPLDFLGIKDLQLTSDFFSQYVSQCFHISIQPSKELCSKIATGEVGVSLPWWCHTLVLPPPGYWGLFLSPIIFS